MEKVLGILGIISKVLIIIVLMVTALLSIGTAYIMFAPDDLPKPFRLMYDFNPVVTAPAAAEKETPTPHEYHPGEGIILTNGTKIINLNGATGSKYIRISISLEFIPPNEKYSEMSGEEKAAYLSEFTTEMNSVMPVIDDTIITCISLKTFDDLYTAAGKEALRSELMEKMSARLKKEKLIGLYFTEFVIN